MKNWKTTITGIGVAITSALTMLAALPYTIGDAAMIIPPDWKAPIMKAGIISALILRVLNSIFQKDKENAQDTKIKSQNQ